METIEIVSIISAMKRQERSYLSKDYLHSFSDQTERHCQFEGASNPGRSVDEDLRLFMINWCYRVVAFFEFRRDTVAISTNYLDRFLSTTEGTNARKNRKIFQLAAMSCLHTAIKIHEVEAIDMAYFSDLSKGFYTVEQFTDMEQTIITSLQWRLNPPTPCSFTQNFLSVIPGIIMSRKEKLVVLKLARYQTELSVREYSFLSYDASCIALASLANSMQATNHRNFQHILRILCKIVELDINSQVFVECRKNLRILMKMKLHSQEHDFIPQKPTANKNVKSIISVHDLDSTCCVDTTFLTSFSSSKSETGVFENFWYSYCSSIPYCLYSNGCT